MGFYLLGYNTVQCVENQAIFRMKIFPLFLWSKRRWRKTHEGSYKHSCACCFIQAAFLLSLLFDTDDGDNIFRRNVGWISADYTMLYIRIQNYSQPTSVRTSNLASKCIYLLHKDNVLLLLTRIIIICTFLQVKLEWSSQEG
jgi:hypothetical protein